MKRPESEAGAALLTVLSVLAVLGIVVGLLMDRARSEIRPWALETERTQATYAAETGIAYQLYLERFSDSSEPSFSPVKPANPDDPFAAFSAPTDTFQYRFDPGTATPEVHVDRTRAFLDITSTGRFRQTSATVFARFGKALDDSIFGAALTLENDAPLEPFDRSQVTGKVRCKVASADLPSDPWPANFSVAAYSVQFTDQKYNAYEISLQKKLAQEGGRSGNGDYTPDHPPEFPGGEDLRFPLGQVQMTNDGDQTWVIRGPGKIFADGEIRLRGRIRLEGIQLVSGKDITFEDSITGEENSAFARGSIFIHDRCNLAIEALAGKDILLRDRSQTATGSVLITVGTHRAGKGGDTLNAIRIVNQAVARGFLIAAGGNGRVVLATPANIVEGVVMANAVWLAGEVRGPVLAQKLLCEGTNTRNCLGTGKIDRSRLPLNFVQPLLLGPSDRKLFTFRLMQWRRS